MELDKELDNFISTVEKGKVAVIIPLFGYWKDIKNNPLNLQTLKLTVERITSNYHEVYIYFVAEPLRTPSAIQNYMVTKASGGNCFGVPIEKENSNYAEYIREGLRVAHESTPSAYFVVINPWNLIQKNAIDIMVDRLNFGDSAKLICGVDLHKEIKLNEFNPNEFDRIRYQVPEEIRGTDFNFMGMTRYALEMAGMDTVFKTRKYLERDLWQTLYTKGYEAIRTERLPMFVFDVSLEQLEKASDVEADKQYFISKWKFDPQI